MFLLNCKTIVAEKFGFLLVNCHSELKDSIQNHGKFSFVHVDYSTSGSSCSNAKQNGH